MTLRIDAHLHYLPPSLAADLSALAEQEPYWSLLLQSEAGRPSLQGWATPEQMIADMDQAGIDKVVLQGEYRMTHAACVARNDAALAIIRRWPDRVMAFACLQPKAGEAALLELRRCLDGGMRGVGELNPYGQAHTLDDPDFLRLAEACIQADIPVNLHVNEEFGHYYLGKTAIPLAHYYHLACRYPELKLILAHWGGGLLFYETMPEVRSRLRNVWYDTAASPLLFPTPKIFPLALQCVDHHKLLYGSDYPLLICPRKQQSPDFRPFLAEIDALGLDQEVRADLMGRNAARLLGLLEPASPPHPVKAEASPMPEFSGQMEISARMSVSAVAVRWPATQAVFDHFGIPWRDSPVPYWEPIVQAAAAHGWGASDQRRLMDELNAAIARKP
jgi:predicted TIM-barrel fold metal-dependent hydrolase